MGKPGERLTETFSVAFPPVTPAGANPGDDYICARADGDRDAALPALSGFAYITHDRGKTWTSLHDGAGALPKLRTYVVRYDPSDPKGQIVYAGTEAGVYRSNDGARSWRKFGTGMPNIPIMDMYVSRHGDLIRIGTWGRGIWETRPQVSN
jgi:hypothetical protein